MLVERHGVSERRACCLVNLWRSVKRHEPKRDDVATRAQVCELSVAKPRWGYRKIYDRLKVLGVKINRDRVRLIRKGEGLQVIRKQKKRRILGNSTDSVSKAEYPNHVWSYDFVHDQTMCGRRLKILTVIDEYTRECLALLSARQIGSQDVLRVLSRLFAERGLPGCIKSDNGPEFVAKRVQKWLAEQRVLTRYIEPGSPWQNGHNESFNAVLRDGCLDRWLFASPREASAVLDAFRKEYNTERPHGSLGGLTPENFASGVARCNQLAA